MGQQSKYLFLVLLSIAVACPCACSEDKLGNQAFDSGQYAAAERRFKLQLKKSQSAGKRDQAYSAALDDLAKIYYFEGRIPQSEQIYKELVSVDEQLFGEDSVRVANDLYALSRCVRRQYRWLDADPILLRVLKIRRKQLGDSNIDVARSWLDLGVNYTRLGKLPQAQEAYRSSFDVQKQLPEAEQHIFYTSIRNYAALLFEMNKVDEANAVLRALKSGSAVQQQLP